MGSGDRRDGVPERTTVARTRDGRNVDERLGVLEGEAADQVVKPLSQLATKPSSHLATQPSSHLTTGRAVGDPANRPLPRPLDQAPGLHRRGGEATLALPLTPTYYDQPLLHEPVWTWMVPAYFYAGGVAGAAGVVGAAAQLLGGRSLRPLVRTCRLVAAAGTTVGAALLVGDLGRPTRFLHMLRVFRPTSPMSVGSWVLAGAGASSALAAACAFAPRRSSLGRLGDGAGVALGLLGVPLSGYTAVLLASTAVPVWHRASRSLPPLFVASSLASLSSLIHALPIETPAPARRVLSVAGTAAKVAKLVAMERVERDARRVPEVGRALVEGRPGALLTAARLTTIASLAADVAAWLLPSSASRTASRIGGVLGTASGVILRFAIADAGRASSTNPRASFAEQRPPVAGTHEVVEPSPTAGSPAPAPV